MWGSMHFLFICFFFMINDRQKNTDRSRLPEILHADISTISTFRRLKGDFRVGRRACMCQVSNSMQCLRAEMSCAMGTWNHLDMSDRF